MKNIDDTEDFMYYLFKSILKLETKNDYGWVSYEELFEYMEQQDYAHVFPPEKLSELSMMYLYDYDSLGIFESSLNEIRLNNGPDANNIRWVFELFELPYRLTEEGTYKQD
jgi:hypothetical protein